MQMHPGSIGRNATARLAIPWPGITAALAAVGMLLIFSLVVSDGAQRGEIRRAAVLSHSDATWRCNAERSKRVREECLALLNSAPRGHNLDWTRK